LDSPHESRVGALVVERAEQRVFYREDELRLTSREFVVLSALAEHPGWVLSAAQLAEADPFGLGSPSAVNVHISHLRAKLAAAGGRDLISTVRGVGWRLRRPFSSEDDCALSDGTAFLGRADETSVLLGHLVPGKGRFALVAGELGIGKTSLVEHVLASAAPGFQVIRAACDAPGSGEHSPWQHILAEIEYGSEASPAERSRLEHPVPGSGEGPGSPPAPQAAVDQGLVYASVARSLKLAASNSSRPIAIFIDDLQWASNASLDLLAYLLKRLAEIPCAIIAACRDTEFSVHDRLRACAEYAMECEPGCFLPLRGLPSAEVSELLGPLFERDDLNAAFVDDLVKRTGGNPFFINEYLRVLRSEGAVPADLNNQVARSVASLVQSQVSCLQPDTRSLLRVAAAMGVSFDPQIAVSAAHGEIDQLSPAIDAGILVEAREGRLRFRHSLIREALLEATPPQELLRLHEAIAETIRRSTTGGHARALRLAHHYARSEPRCHATAIGYYVAAARGSFSRHAFGDAVASLAAALELAAGAYSDQTKAARVRSEVLERLGSAHAAAGDYSSARAPLEEALEARPKSDVVARVRLLTKLGNASAYSRQPGLCATYLSDALALLGSIRPRGPAWWREWIEVRLCQAKAAQIEDMPAPFKDVRRELEDKVLRYGSAQQRSKYYFARAAEQFASARYQVDTGCLGAQRTAVEEAGAAGSVYLSGYMTGYLGALLVHHRDAQEGEAYLRQSLDLTRTCGDSQGEAAALFNLALASRLAGDIRGAEAMTDELASVVEGQELMPEFAVGVDANRGWIALRRGDLTEARRLSERAIERWLRSPACSRHAWLMAWPAVECALAGEDVQHAVECAELMTRPSQQALAGDLDAHLAQAVHTWVAEDADTTCLALNDLCVRAREFGYA
jgi:DNA-binding winged helix-turn-helix (wHTH) protein/tetratricopeptide (TPR) repeat protein